MKVPVNTTAAICYHCGESLNTDTIIHDEKTFCCEGCKSVYEILIYNHLQQYYNLNQTPGLKEQESTLQYEEKYAWLDDEQLRQELIQFSDGNISTITFKIPSIHCSSCIWLLENLWKINPGVVRVQVNFLRRTVHITFDENTISLRKLVELLAAIGYPPELKMAASIIDEPSKLQRHWYYRLGIAFFCFGNIMLLSFPEYFGIDVLAESNYRYFFGYLNFLLSLPVLLYSASVFFRSAWVGLRHGLINMDVPIVLGIIVMFMRSSWEIFSHSGSGYMDTLASLVFLMLIGRMFQNKTYDRLSFDRDYKSYFPMAITVLRKEKETTIPVANIQQGDRILIRNEEIIPADGILMQGTANIDYSFVTGESIPIEKVNGEIIYAGGRQKGNAIELEIIREVSQSYLTQLWNDAVFHKQRDENVTSLAGKVSKVFTFIILAIAVGSALYWLKGNSERALNAFTAVLIITCPCALAISSPFTLGNILRLLGKYKIYLKNSSILETMATADTIIFDKTGTITQNGAIDIKWEGDRLNDVELAAIRLLVKQSSHPLSRRIYSSIPNKDSLILEIFEEYPGKGIKGTINSLEISIGSQDFVSGGNYEKNNPVQSTIAYVSINGIIRGYYSFQNEYRLRLKEIIKKLQRRFRLGLLSGDNNTEEPFLIELFGSNTELKFNQTPLSKLEHIVKLQSLKRKVIMIGDGLNDAGALKKSNVGLSISDNINNFSPACDGIIDATAFDKIPALFQIARSGRKILVYSFILSFIYNIVGLWFAVQGTLSPLIAAILMPISSITIILFTTIATRIAVAKIMQS